MKKKEKRRALYLFVDGTNLYAAQYELFGPKEYLNFSEFIKEIQRKIKIKFDKIYFYASYSPKSKQSTKKQRAYLKNEALFYRSVKETKNTVFFKGYRSKTSGKEKEVDVKLAVDIVDFAHLDKYDNLFLLSGDADFMHALTKAVKLKKKVAILALENRIPNRFVYFYKTFILKFDLVEEIKINKKQRIKIVCLKRSKIIKTL